MNSNTGPRLSVDHRMRIALWGALGTAEPLPGGLAGYAEGERDVGSRPAACSGDLDGSGPNLVRMDFVRRLPA